MCLSNGSWEVILTALSSHVPIGGLRVIYRFLSTTEMPTFQFHIPPRGFLPSLGPPFRICVQQAEGERSLRTSILLPTCPWHVTFWNALSQTAVVLSAH